MTDKHLYRIHFTSQGKAYELYARQVSQGEMFGFVVVEELVFGEKSAIVVDPGEEALKNEFSGVKRLHIPYHAISRIDEVARQGKGRVLSLTGDPPAPTPPVPPGPQSRNG